MTKWLSSGLEELVILSFIIPLDNPGDQVIRLVTTKCKSTLPRDMRFTDELLVEQKGDTTGHVLIPNAADSGKISTNLLPSAAEWLPRSVLTVNDFSEDFRFERPKLARFLYICTTTNNIIAWLTTWYKKLTYH